MDDREFTGADLRNEAVYDSVRAAVRAAPGSAPGPIIKPLPPDWFYVYESSSIGANAEMRWEVMKDKGYLVPTENFYIRDHTSTPVIDASTWQPKVFGTGLRGAPTAGNAVTFSYEDLLRMPSATVISFIECAGNAREFRGGCDAAGPGSGLRDRRRGLRARPAAGAGGQGPGRRDPGLRDERPAAAAGQRVPGPVHLPVLVGVANVKWVGQIEVSATPLFSYWNTLAYRLFGPTYPANGTLITRQVVKSSFELAWNAQLASARPQVLTGRSWSGNGRIAHTDVSTDGGQTWRRARARDRGLPTPGSGGRSPGSHPGQAPTRCAHGPPTSPGRPSR